MIELEAISSGIARETGLCCDSLPNKPFGIGIIIGATIWISLQMKTGVPRLLKTYWARTSRWKHEDVNFLLSLDWCGLIVQLSRILMKTVKAMLSSLPSSQIVAGQGRTHAWDWSPQLSSNGHWRLKKSPQARPQWLIGLRSSFSLSLDSFWDRLQLCWSYQAGYQLVILLEHL